MGKRKSPEELIDYQKELDSIPTHVVTGKITQEEANLLTAAIKKSFWDEIEPDEATDERLNEILYKIYGDAAKDAKEKETDETTAH